MILGAGFAGLGARRPDQSRGECFIDFGGGMVGKVEANFPGGPQPTARMIGPTLELSGEQDAFGAERRAR